MGDFRSNGLRTLIRRKSADAYQTFLGALRKAQGALRVMRPPVATGRCTSDLKAGLSRETLFAEFEVASRPGEAGTIREGAMA